MPGLFGVAGAARDTATLTGDFARMFEPAVRQFAHESLIDAASEWALGRTHLGVLHPDAQLSGTEPVQVLFHGDLYNWHVLDTTASEPNSGAGVARLIAGTYSRQGLQLLQRIQRRVPVW